MIRLLFSLLLLSVLACEAQSQGSAVAQQISMPPGFEIEVWSDNVPNARSLALGTDGTVYVSTRRDGRVYALRERADQSPEVMEVARNLNVPNGLAYHDGALYVAELTRILRYDAIASALPTVPEPQVVFDGLPGESHHGWRYIAFGPDGRLYISIGAPCNVCERPGFANISRIDLETGAMEVYAEGVRNSVGFTWHPLTGELWFTDNGRDMLGDDLPPDELNRAYEPGMHFGFPYCHAGEISDPEFGDGRSCADFASPAMKLGPHVAALGVLFYTGEMFPEEYRGRAFIAEHGSWNRSKKIGYRVSTVPVENGVATGYEVFAEGWLQDVDVSGRPVDLLQLADGSLLVSDDKGGRIYRISYSRPLTAGIAEDGE